MRAVLVACALVAALAACNKSQTVAKATTCGEPCCGGNADGIDCAENHELQCVERDDACDAGRPFGCSGGVFFQSAMTVCEIEAGPSEAGLAGDGGDLIVLPGDDGAPEVESDAGSDSASAGGSDAATDAGSE